MKMSLVSIKDKRQLESILLVFILVATSMIVIFPLTAPKAKAVFHLTSTSAEDGNPLYDTDGSANNRVVWADFDDHIINDPLGYIVDPGYTLEIPNLNYQGGGPAENVIEFQFPGNRIDVMGTLITNSAPEGVFQYTAFTGGDPFFGWDGIYFHPGSQGNISDVLILNSQNGIVMGPGSNLIEPGVEGSRFEEIHLTGMTMDLVTGYTNINGTSFHSPFGPVARGKGLEIHHGELNITNSYFNSHGPDLPSLDIFNADVSVDNVQFAGNFQQGYGVYVEGGLSNGTVLNDCEFINGVADNHYILVNGSSILINNNTFLLGSGQLSVSAVDDMSGVPAAPILRNPNPPGTTFDNSTINVTGGSSLTLQWFLDVYVEDPDSNYIPNRQVWVKDINGDPAIPGTKMTNVTGWATWFLCTEFIQYAASFDNKNHYNISALNNSMYGYSADAMNMSKTVTIIVPFNPIPNDLPKVTQMNLRDSDPQSGPVAIEFVLEDPNPGDDGVLSIEVYYDFDGVPVPGGGLMATAHPTSDPTSGLSNNTLYTFVWDSSLDVPDLYNTTVHIMIVPFDSVGNGTPYYIGPFTLDNLAPDILTGPTIEVIYTTAWINWTVDEVAEASVWYGFTEITPVLTTETVGSSGSVFQSVELTSLQPGRQYTFAINSTDPQGNTGSSYPTTYPFQTEVRIYLQKGWNMISFPPYLLLGGDVSTTLFSIAGQYNAVRAYYSNDPADPWKHYVVGKPFGNDLLDLDEVHGFWIHMKNDAVLIPAHMDPTTDPGFLGYTSVIMVEGWNFVSYPSVANRPINDALAGVPYDMVQTYNASSGMWETWDGATGNLNTMQMGNGYWIHITIPFYFWDVDYVI